MNFSIELNDSDFTYFRNLVYDICGICISADKKEMLKCRINKRLKDLNLESYKEYKNYIKNNSEEITNFINAVSTNKTDFFREKNHFDFLSEHIKKNINKMKDLYIWSAACSTGEEPYSIAMTLNEELYDNPNVNSLILATDIDTNVLAKAYKGSYKHDQIQGIPRHLLLKYFEKSGDSYNIKKNLREVLRFKHLNLIEPFPFNKKFDFIFCRNVMIYFDSKTQQELVNKFYNMIKPGGYLFIGHSESLTRLNIKFKYIKPAVYQKAE
ncbi:protein-glutamate O-methyltransferase CheR [Candidatus Dependentiae bacterium]|nr:protein-glutamate O-methyltransferase CheR [Candidatus Dependentiae bacterium]